MHQLWCGGPFAECKFRDLHQVIESDLVSLHSEAFGTRLVAQGFVLMQDNDPKYIS